MSYSPGHNMTWTHAGPIAAEIDRGIGFHGPLTDPVRAHVILTEEVGELAAEILDYTRETPTSTLQAAYVEATQCAAMSVRIMQMLKELQK